MIFRPENSQLYTPSRGVSIVSQSRRPWWLPSGITVAQVARAYQPKNAASLANSYVNLVSPGTGDTTLGGAPNWNATDGWQFVAANSDHLKTGYVPITTSSMFFRFSNYSHVTDCMFAGVSDAAVRYFTIQQAASATRFYHGGSGNIYTHGSLITSGVLGITNDGAYVDGAKPGAPGGLTGNVAAGKDVYIGCRKWDTGPSNFTNCYMQAFVLFTVTLTDAQAAELSASMAAL